MVALAISFGAAGLIVIAVEGIFYFLNHRPDRTGGEDPYLFQFSDLLGYKPLPNTDQRAWRTYDGETVFDVRYRTDEFGRRVTPSPEGADRFLVFFGCSFVFGEGIAENESLPAQTARLLPGVHAYNYGFSGYGPQQMLAKLESETLGAELTEPTGDAVYVFISDHVRRAIGSMRMWKQWGRHFPCYVLEDGAPVRHGSFLIARPRLSRFYDLLSREQIFRYFNVDVPLSVSAKDIDLTSEIIEASAHRFAEQFPGGRLLVVMYPEPANSENVVYRIVPKLENSGIEVLNLEGLFDLTDPQYHVPHDGHPSAEANALVAREIANKLAKPAREGASR